MIPRRAALAALLCLVVGCSKGFKSESDELKYLSSLSRPSVKQLHRKKELEAKAAAVWARINELEAGAK